jgi:ubiquitin carboxyl-terminal hydrolase 10
MVPTAGRPVALAQYTLYGVLHYHGASASGGHFTVDVLNRITHGGDKDEETWLHIDDENVSIM